MRVKFLIDTGGDVFAYFPDEYYNREQQPNMRVCYAHVGQHSGCAVDYASGCELASYNQYEELFKELRCIAGYKNLIVINPDFSKQGRK